MTIIDRAAGALRRRWEHRQHDRTLERLERAEQGAGLEWAPDAPRTNRGDRRRLARDYARATRRPVACLQLRHPLLKTLTPHGAKVLGRRLAAAKAARFARRLNRR